MMKACQSEFARIVSYALVCLLGAVLGLILGVLA